MSLIVIKTSVNNVTQMVTVLNVRTNTSPSKESVSVNVMTLTVMIVMQKECASNAIMHSIFLKTTDAGVSKDVKKSLLFME